MVDAKRILIATHAPLDPKFGAAQMALNLCAALRELGHHAEVWSPYPLESEGPARFQFWFIRQKFRQFIRGQEQFDLIDTAPSLWIDDLRRNSKRVLCRSVQPEILYLFAGQSAGAVTNTDPWRRIVGQSIWCVDRLLRAAIALNAWRQADSILCLGSLEYEWMRRKFPFWRAKLRWYSNALSAQDQEKLSAVRKARRPLPAGAPVKFLWIGRWTEQKGISALREFILQRVLLNDTDTFTIAGCGSEAESAFPAELIGKRVFVLPEFERSAIPALLQTHDVGLFTSPVEGWGLSINEMIESGMTVFAADSGGVPDLRAVVPEAVKPFPPPPVLSDLTPLSEETMKQYYSVFNWQRSARAILSVIGASFESAGG